MQQISIILNGIKRPFDSIILLIHVRRNPYDIAFVSYVLLDVEAQQSDLLFDSSVYANVAINQLSNPNSNESNK